MAKSYYNHSNNQPDHLGSISNRLTLKKIMRTEGQQAILSFFVLGALGPSELDWFAYLILVPRTNSGHSTDQRGRGAIVKTINILNIYQVLTSATISKCEVCGQEFVSWRIRRTKT